MELSVLMAGNSRLSKIPWLPLINRIDAEETVNHLSRFISATVKGNT